MWQSLERLTDTVHIIAIGACDGEWDSPKASEVGGT